MESFQIDRIHRFSVCQFIDLKIMEDGTISERLTPTFDIERKIGEKWILVHCCGSKERVQQFVDDYHVSKINELLEQLQLKKVDIKKSNDLWQLSADHTVQFEANTTELLYNMAYRFWRDYPKIPGWIYRWDHLGMTLNLVYLKNGGANAAICLDQTGRRYTVRESNLKVTGEKILKSELKKLESSVS